MRYIIEMKALFSALVLLCMSVSLCGAQTKKFIGINDVAAAGQIVDGKYKNSFLGLTVDAPNSTQTLNPLVVNRAQRARLVQVLAKQASWEDTYTFAVLADLLSVNPLTKKPSDYLSNLR